MLPYRAIYPVKSFKYTFDHKSEYIYWWATINTASEDFYG